MKGIEMDTTAVIHSPENFADLVDTLRNQLADEKLRVMSANARIENLDSAIDKMAERLMDHVEQGNIDGDVADDLASYIGRDLVRSINVRLTVEIDAEVVVPVGYDLSDLAGDIEIDVVPLYCTDIQIDAENIASIEVEEI
jgi:hypothetical protein